jgi:signal peptidase I
VDGYFYLNNEKIQRDKINNEMNISCGNETLNVEFFEETLMNGKKYLTVYKKEGTLMNTDKFIVPEKHYFFMGDNRDCSKDSRFLSSVGYVSINNLVGKARWIFFSNDQKVGSFFKFWKWKNSIRLERFFKSIK